MLARVSTFLLGGLYILVAFALVIIAAAALLIAQHQCPPSVSECTIPEQITYHLLMGTVYVDEVRLVLHIVALFSIALAAALLTISTRLIGFAAHGEPAWAAPIGISFSVALGLLLILSMAVLNGLIAAWLDGAQLADAAVIEVWRANTDVWLATWQGIVVIALLLLIVLTLPLMYSQKNADRRADLRVNPNHVLCSRCGLSGLNPTCVLCDQYFDMHHNWEELAHMTASLGKSMPPMLFSLVSKHNLPVKNMHITLTYPRVVNVRVIDDRQWKPSKPILTGEHMECTLLHEGYISSADTDSTVRLQIEVNDVVKHQRKRYTAYPLSFSAASAESHIPLEGTFELLIERPLNRRELAWNSVKAFASRRAASIGQFSRSSSARLRALRSPRNTSN